uniref:Uncharacterized protein n=1 Tax=Photinus pyralis TaxID=7054 RepID=A0A1Y1N6T0_PHOPY
MNTNVSIVKSIYPTQVTYPISANKVHKSLPISPIISLLVPARRYSITIFVTILQRAQCIPSSPNLLDVRIKASLIEFSRYPGLVLVRKYSVMPSSIRTSGSQSDFWTTMKKIVNNNKKVTLISNYYSHLDHTRLSRDSRLL